MPKGEATPEQRDAFAFALAEALGERSAASLGRQLGIERQSVSQWLRGGDDRKGAEPSRAHVFAAERCLDLPKGSLSRHLGYLPVGAYSPSTALDAIREDPLLTPAQRRFLLDAYTEAVGRS